MSTSTGPPVSWLQVLIRPPHAKWVSSAHQTVLRSVLCDQGMLAVEAGPVSSQLLPSMAMKVL